MDVAADATQCILLVFECSFSVGVVAGNQYEVDDRLHELNEVGMPIKKRGQRRKPDLHHVLVLSTGPLSSHG